MHSHNQGHADTASSTSELHQAATELLMSPEETGRYIEAEMRAADALAAELEAEALEADA